MNFSDWGNVELAIVGVGLQLIGLSIAVSGVRDQHRSLVGGPLSFREAVGEFGADSRRWFRRAVLRRKETAVITGLGAVMSTSDVGGAFVSSGPPPPPDGATDAELIEYLTKRVDSLEGSLDSTRTWLRDQIKEEAKKANTKLSDHSERIGQLEGEANRTRRALIGVEGHALRRTALGLAITAVGVALTVLSPIVG